MLGASWHTYYILLIDINAFLCNYISVMRKYKRKTESGNSAADISAAILKIKDGQSIRQTTTECNIPF